MGATAALSDAGFGVAVAGAFSNCSGGGATLVVGEGLAVFDGVVHPVMLTSSTVTTINNRNIFFSRMLRPDDMIFTLSIIGVAVKSCLFF